MSLAHGEEVYLPDEGIGPALMIRTPSETTTALTSTKDRPQSPSDPPIDGREGVRITLLVGCEPAPEDRIDELNDPFETVPVRSTRPFSDRILELSQTLLAQVASQVRFDQLQHASAISTSISCIRRA